MVPIYKLKPFARFARSENIDDENLVEAVERAGRGLVDADLGGGLIKQRVARKGQGRRGGYRVMVAIRSADYAVFLFGFAKRCTGQSRRPPIEHPSRLCRRRAFGGCRDNQAGCGTRVTRRGAEMTKETKQA